jgi:sigma-B regulation protein RsbU (phosphoserine phosphatase)
MVLRQGLQYALAKTGVRVLQVAGSAVVVFAAATLASDTTRNRAQKITAIAIGFIAILMFRRVAERLRAWTDRRFFRDAYNAEQILTDLSEEVRSIVEPRALLQTVSQKIAESLHVCKIAVLLNSAGPYRPEFALGYPASLNVDFPYDAETVKQLRTAKEPARIYLDDPESWINRDGEITSEERSRLTELETELLLPLNSRDRLLGFISLGHKLSEEPYSGADLRLLKSVAAQTGLALENAQLTTKVAQEMAQREKMNRELEIAREVQERLYPQHLPPVAGLDYSGLCRPALGVGGDYYDFIPLSGGKLGIAIGDVSGKGISAALMMASLQASLRGQAMVAPDDLATIVTNVNQLVYEASSSNRYATFFYAQYHPNTRQLVYVNAGHNPPLLLRKKQASRLASEGDAQGFQVERLDTGGLVVGLLPEVSYQQGSITLQPGDTLLAYTDGVSEAMNPTGEEWGEEHMLQAAEACEGMNAQETIRHVVHAADEFSQGAPQHDDMTLVVVQAV